MNNNTLLRFQFLLLLFITFALPLTASVTAGKYAHSTTGDTAKRKKSVPIVFPVPAGYPAMLFYLQRDPNTNTLIYELNIDKETGKPDTENPMHVYWVKYNEKGQREELNYIQRKFAYGLVSKPLGNDRYDIRFVSYKKFPLTLMKAADGKYHIFASVAQKQIALQKVYIKIEGGYFWLPNIVFVEMKGTDTATGKEIAERFKP